MHRVADGNWFASKQEMLDHANEQDRLHREQKEEVKSKVALPI